LEQLRGADRLLLPRGRVGSRWRGRLEGASAPIMPRVKGALVDHLGEETGPGRASGDDSPNGTGPGRRPAPPRSASTVGQTALTRQSCHALPAPCELGGRDPGLARPQAAAPTSPPRRSTCWSRRSSGLGTASATSPTTGCGCCSTAGWHGRLTAPQDCEARSPRLWRARIRVAGYSLLGPRGPGATLVRLDAGGRPGLASRPVGSRHLLGGVPSTRLVRSRKPFRRVLSEQLLRRTPGLPLARAQVAEAKDGLCLEALAGTHRWHVEDSAGQVCDGDRGSRHSYVPVERPLNRTPGRLRGTPSIHELGHLGTADGATSRWLPLGPRTSKSMDSERRASLAALRA
jgi:hypothetical protein